MKILFRYLLREYAKIFMMCFSGLMTIYLVIDFFEKVRRFLRYDASWLDVLAYFALKVPAISFQIAPLAILMATLLTLGLLSRSHEITAMRSCGISLPWIASPFLSLATVVALILLLFSSTVIPLASNKAEEIRAIRIEKKPPSTVVKLPQPWARMGADHLLHVATVAIGGEALGGVQLFHFDTTFRLVDMTEAEEARYAGGAWTLYRGFKRIFNRDGSITLNSFERMPVPLTLIPADFTTWLASESESMTFRTIREYTGRLYQNSSQITRLRTDYYGRIAFPFVTIIMVLIGIALSLRRSGVRGGSMAIGIGQALAIGFCYWTTHSIAIAFGRGGALPPIVAGWLTDVLFMSYGLYLMLKVRY
ncbi:putative Permease, YjgP/YjgQ family [Nitrospira sp. KM1]|uniref:LPS export ABC transporter permease LptG n=1 Tax=Nitrospira sp. KM1 TaxID=1936990 RepID=UPI0013A750B7|nr:LPS export ABC transporter permease LptG [Nitrospira sp. KM1]BCA53625.1 putative Permease, YjgP/YjgQ family [Nitrospira sp. KM1]